MDELRKTREVGVFSPIPSVRAHDPIQLCEFRSQLHDTVQGV